MAVFEVDDVGFPVVLEDDVVLAATEESDGAPDEDAAADVGLEGVPALDWSEP